MGAKTIKGEVETMEELVREMGEDKIERKQTRPNNNRKPRKATEEVAEEKTTKEE